MKNFKYLLLIICLGSITSCTDAIEIEQPGRLGVEDTFKTVADLELGVLGLYNEFDLTPEIGFTTVFTDEIAQGNSDNFGGQGQQLYAFQLNPTSFAPTNIWLRNYRAINVATRIIEASQFVEIKEDEQSIFNNTLGQAYALRAFAHFQLQSYFTTDYTDDSAFGVIAVDYIPNILDTPLRNTNAEVFELINSDLDIATDLITSQADATFISQDFITAFRARMAAYRENYSLAGSLAEELLDSGRYSIADTTQYKNMFLDTDNTEIIFKLERTIDDFYDGQETVVGGGWAGSLWAFTNATIEGGPYFEIGRSLFNQLDTTDVRFEVIVAPTSLISKDYQNSDNYPFDDILVNQKYPGSENQPLMNDLKVFRLSEMLLILAESRADAGNFNGEMNSTASLLKQLRDARLARDTPLPAFSSETEAFGAILDERRIELAFEGHRYKDLKRLGLRANRKVNRDPLDCEVNGACMLNPDDFKFTFPIPLIEFDANPGLREQQNPGY